MILNTLTTTEEQLMLIMWDLKQFYTKELMESLPEPKPHQNTVSTYLKILIEKGFLTAEREGRIFRYSIAISKQDYRLSLLKSLSEMYYENDAKSVIDDLITLKIINLNEDKPLFAISDEMPTEKKEKKKRKKREKRKKIVSNINQ